MTRFINNNLNLASNSKYSPEYKRKYHPFIQRLNAIFHILFNSNFILITNINKYENNKQKGKKLKVIIRTNYDKESDYLSCLTAAKICKAYIEKTT